MALEKLVIEGGKQLEGTVRVSGSKNAALPILAATILGRGRSTITNVPDLMDVRTLGKILGELGVQMRRRPDGAIECEAESEERCEAPYDLVSQMRASICVLGPLLARRGYAKVALPGGCVIGTRPIELHLKGLAALGAIIKEEHGYVEAHGRRLRGARIFLGGAAGSTVLGTTNVMCAAALAEGKTVINGAACEPEVEDLARFLNKMGATIEGAGTAHVTITGVPELRGARHDVIPDRIEAGTFLAAAAMAGGDVRVEGARLDHLDAMLDKLREAGIAIEALDDGVARIACDGFRPQPVDVTTLPYPFFPTDMQAQLMAFLSVAEGISVVTENIFPDRFMHVAELNRMGARIRKQGPTAVVSGVEALSGAPVMASDLRASAALVLAGLVARGKTEVRRVYHIDRGYEKIEEKLVRLGARIERKADSDA